MPDPTSNDSQSHSREHIGIVSLPRNEGPAIFQGHTLKRTSTGKDPSALEAGRKPEMEPGDGFQAVMASFYLLNVEPFFILSHMLNIVLAHCRCCRTRKLSSH